MKHMKYFYTVIVMFTIEHQLCTMDSGLESKIIRSCLSSGNKPSDKERNDATLERFASIGSAPAQEMVAQNYGKKPDGTNWTYAEIQAHRAATAAMFKKSGCDANGKPLPVVTNMPEVRESRGMNNASSSHDGGDHTGRHCDRSSGSGGGVTSITFNGRTYDCRDSGTEMGRGSDGMWGH